MLNKSQELFEQWNENSLHYCHWKSNEHLQEGLNGDTDLDVLLSINDKNKGCMILRELGFLKFNSQYGSRYPNVEDWIGFDERTGRLLHVHLHYSLMTGHTGMKEYELPWTKEALHTCIQDKGSGVCIMNPHLELTTLFTRLILKAKYSTVFAAKRKKYSIDKHFLREIYYIKSNIQDWHQVLSIANKYYGEESKSFMDIVRSERMSSSQFMTLYRIVSNAMEKYSRYHGISLLVRRLFYYFLVNARNVLRRKFGWMLITRKVLNKKKGLTIAFVGQDGSGKSTVTNHIQRWLDWKIESRIFYLGSGDQYNPWQKKLLVLLSNYNNPIIKLVKYYLSFILQVKWSRLVETTIDKSQKYVKKGGIAIFDRYPQMQYSGINDGPKIREKISTRLNAGLVKFIAEQFAKREEKILMKAVEKEPDIVFKLLLSPEESITRKPFENYENVKRKHEVIKNLKFKKSDVYEIDASQNYEDELIQIKNIIWNHIQKL